MSWVPPAPGCLSLCIFCKATQEMVTRHELHHALPEVFSDRTERTLLTLIYDKIPI